MTRILIGGVGYRNLRDYSCGVVLSDRLAARQWPPNVTVEDISYNPIAVVQRLQDEPREAPFDLAIVAGAVAREGRAAGTLTVYRWDNALPDADGIQGAIAEAVTGVIALDNTLIVARHFDALPSTVIVIEIEPDVHEFGDELTPAIERAIDEAAALIARLVQEPRMAQQMREGALRIGRQRDGGVKVAKVASDARVH